MRKKIWHKVSDNEYPNLKREFVYINNKTLFYGFTRSMSKWISNETNPQKHCKVMEIEYWAYLDELLPKDIYDNIKEHNPSIQ